MKKILISICLSILVISIAEARIDSVRTCRTFLPNSSIEIASDIGFIVFADFPDVFPNGYPITESNFPVTIDRKKISTYIGQYKQIQFRLLSQNSSGLCTLRLSSTEKIILKFALRPKLINCSIEPRNSSNGYLKDKLCTLSVSGQNLTGLTLKPNSLLNQKLISESPTQIKYEFKTDVNKNISTNSFDHCFNPINGGFTNTTITVGIPDLVAEDITGAVLQSRFNLHHQVFNCGEDLPDIVSQDIILPGNKKGILVKSPQILITNPTAIPIETPFVVRVKKINGNLILEKTIQRIDGGSKLFIDMPTRPNSRRLLLTCINRGDPANGVPDVIVSGDGGGVTEQGRPAQWYDEGVIIEVDVNGVVTKYQS